MWISKKKWNELNKRVSALEQAEQERKSKEEHVKTHSTEGLEKAAKLLGFR